MKMIMTWARERKVCTEEMGVKKIGGEFYRGTAFPRVWVCVMQKRCDWDEIWAIMMSFVFEWKWKEGAFSVSRGCGWSEGKVGNRFEGIYCKNRVILAFWRRKFTGKSSRRYALILIAVCKQGPRRMRKPAVFKWNSLYKCRLAHVHRFWSIPFGKRNTFRLNTPLLATSFQSFFYFNYSQQQLALRKKNQFPSCPADTTATSLTAWYTQHVCLNLYAIKAIPNAKLNFPWEREKRLAKCRPTCVTQLCSAHLFNIRHMVKRPQTWHVGVGSDLVSG